MAGVRILSNFWDYYDHWGCQSSDTPDWVYERYSDRGPGKPEQFRLLEELGLDTPLHGGVPAVAKELREKEEHSDGPPPLLVVYTDEQAHAGEGKQALVYYHALATHPQAYCSEFIQTSLSLNAAISYRVLWIGERIYKLRYTSIGDWRSNAGNQVNIEVIEDGGWLPTPNRLSPPLKPHPLVAIDFICQHGSNKLLAIDFNIAPGILNTGIERLLPPKECYKLIADYALLYC